ncbi:hypothetical protein D3C84_725350 [compost metagenome]
MSENEWSVLWDRAKDLEKQVSVKKKEAFSKLKATFPSIKQNNFYNLARAGREGKLPNDVAAAVAEYEGPIAQMIKDANYHRQESKRLVQQKIESETRPLLNPAIDPIPPGPHQKLKNCKAFPLRQCCNHGENEQARWKRCDYMKFSETRGWQCTAPE